jgi:hypothetical protein
MVLWGSFLEKTQVVMNNGVVDIEHSKLPLMSNYRDICIIASKMKSIGRKCKGDNLMNWGEEETEEEDLEESETKTRRGKKRQRRGDKVLIHESLFDKPSLPKFKMPSVKKRKIKSRQFVSSDSSDDDFIDFVEDDIKPAHRFRDPYKDLVSIFSTDSSSSSSIGPESSDSYMKSHLRETTESVVEHTSSAVGGVISDVQLEKNLLHSEVTKIIDEPLIGETLANLDLNSGEQEDIVPELFYHQLNDYSRNRSYHVGLNPEKELTSQTNYPSSRSSFIGNPNFTDRMALSTCLAFIYIALRSINVDVFVSDLLNWMDHGHLPFYSACKDFPEDWLLLDFEINVFRPTKSMTPFGLLTKAKEMISFLDFRFNWEVAQVSINSLVNKFLDQLNLPSDLITVLEESVPSSRFESVVKKLGDPEFSFERRQLPFFECNAIVLIIIALKEAFGLEDSNKEPNRFQDESDEQMEKLSRNDFDFYEWLRYSHVRLLSIKSHVTPLFGVAITEVDDEDIVMKDFFHRIQPRSQIRFGRRQEPNLPDMFGRLDYALEGIQELIDYDISGKKLDGKSPFFPAKYPTTFLNDATDFAIDRLKRKGKEHVVSVLEKDFRNKSLLKVIRRSARKDYPAMSSYNNVILDHSKGGKWFEKCKQLIESFPESQKLLFSFASIILHIPDYRLIPEIIRIERMLFPQCFPRNNFSKRRKNKKDD